jgi:hypothetical protein
MKSIINRVIVPITMELFPLGRTRQVGVSVNWGVSKKMTRITRR